MSRTLLVAAISAIVFGAVSVSGGPAFAAAKSACKGLTMEKCGGESSCAWVKSYKNKSGKTVAAHCRAKGKKAAKSKAPAAPKTN